MNQLINGEKNLLNRTGGLYDIASPSRENSIEFGAACIPDDNSIKRYLT